MQNSSSTYDSFKIIEFWEEIKLKVRSRLVIRSLQPAKQRLQEMSIINFVDFFRFPTGLLSHKYPNHYLKFLINFWKFQSKLKIRSWSALSMVYSRPIILWYYYQLFWWGEYCGVLPKILDHPELSLIPELFTRYIVEIDSIIDTKGGSEYLEENIRTTKRECAYILRELLLLMWDSKTSLSQKTKREVCKKIWAFRYNSLMVSRSTQYEPNLDFGRLLFYKNNTAGDLSRVWVDLLCDVYEVESCRENSKQIFGFTAMAIQVIDDILDSSMDYHNEVHNIFVRLLMETPGELNIACRWFTQHPSDYLDWVWSNKHLPITSNKAVNLITDNINDIGKISENHILTSELCDLLREWRVLYPNNQAD
jgi:hypothetical protein